MVRKTAIKRLVKGHKIAKVIVRVIRSNESDECGYWKIDNPHTDWDWINIDTVDSRNDWVEKLRLLEAENLDSSKNVSTWVRLWWWTGQDRPENRSEFYKQTGLGDVWGNLSRRGFVKSGFYDDGTFHSEMNITKVIDFLENCVTDWQIDKMESDVESEINSLESEIVKLRQRQESIRSIVNS